MSKQNTDQRQRTNRRSWSRRSQVGVLIVLVLGLLATSATASRWGSLRRMIGFAPAVVSTAPPPQSTPTPTLTKEYIYVGGRLVATEEPASTASGAGPNNLIATATSDTGVLLTWTAPAAGAVSHYQVERSQSLSGAYTTLSPNPTMTTFIDSAASGGTAYLYRVRAVFTSQANSEYSNRDLATTVIFSNDPLSAGVTVMKEHLTELRQAINAVRAAAVLTPVVWTDATPGGVVIQAVHVEELRTNLDPALSALGITLAPYTDTSLTGVKIKKEHVQELRQRVK
ncbi:MAG: fibronectin type III domain-containing protein [Acidobacteriota bacterium]|nr:fibronectin type III domain-containing protein [Acidobacteriota bacterium]